MSFDSVERNRAFAEKHKFPFLLLCDTKRELGTAYGAAADAKTKMAARLTFLIDAKGRIEQAIKTDSPGEQAAEILKSLR
ncbi:MAG: peroxiredoxin [Planctomycetota bacterium]